MKLLITLCLVCCLVVSSSPATQPTLSIPSWYKNQLGTGIGNCGPASVAMAIEWSLHKPISVERVRSDIGYAYKDGRTSVVELRNALGDFKVPHRGALLTSPDELKKILSSSLVIVCVKAGALEGAKYKYTGGHYVIISGIRDKSFIIQDPLEGPNRLLNTDLVWGLMAFPDALVITRE